MRKFAVYFFGLVIPILVSGTIIAAGRQTSYVATVSIDVTTGAANVVEVRESF